MVIGHTQAKISRHFDLLSFCLLSFEKQHIQMNRDIWIKAAVIGSLWGASEIVLGSFLHNLRMPFSGNMLTAIGIILMVAGHRLWPERGLLIRAGLICAALKTLSPSPVILGPMLSIFMQAMLMETALMATRRSQAGYVIGGGLAVSWNLFYRIMSTIILYGSSLITLYQHLIDYFVSQTAWQTESYWGPILILWALFFTWGAAAGILGIILSRSARLQQHTWQLAQGTRSTQQAPQMPQNASKEMSVHRLLLRLGGVILLLAGGLYSINVLPAGQSGAVLAVFLLIWWLYNKNTMLRLAKKRGFWLALAIMVGLSGLLLENTQGFSTTGMWIGVQMGMRAIYVIGGFSIISQELQRPQMGVIFGNRRMQPFLAAVRVAFQTTPLLIDTLPGKEAWRRPGRVLTQMVAGMEHALEYMRGQFANPAPTIIITGDKGSGKTTLISQTADILALNGVLTAGVLQPAIAENQVRIGYAVKDLGTGEKTWLCRRDDNLSTDAPGRFQFVDQGLTLGEAALCPERVDEAAVLMVDEIGPYELQGEGWDQVLQKLLPGFDKPAILVVRPSCIDEVINRYRRSLKAIYTAKETNPEDLARDILELC